MSNIYDKPSTIAIELSRSVEDLDIPQGLKKSIDEITRALCFLYRMDKGALRDEEYQ